MRGEREHLASGTKEQSVLWSDLASAQLALEQNSAARLPPSARLRVSSQQVRIRANGPDRPSAAE